MTIREYKALKRRTRRKKAAVRVPSVSGQTRPERVYNSAILHGMGRYEPERLRITPDYAEEHHYTPDFVSFTDIGDRTQRVYHEVKGTYRLGSQDAARLRWTFAALAYEDYWFVWAKWRKDGLWDVEIWRHGGADREAARGVRGYRFERDGRTVWQRT